MSGVGSGKRPTERILESRLEIGCGRRLDKLNLSVMNNPPALPKMPITGETVLSVASVGTILCL